ncbi:MAG: hypothetical protein AB7R89_06035 [Dehalococcoidia bacterium]
MTEERPRRQRLPQLPEHPDEGCRYHPSCLSCPFPVCVFEVPAAARERIEIVGDTMQCAKCRGRLRYEAGIDGHVLKCHQCGSEIPAQAPAAASAQPANGTVPRLAHVATPDWIAGAKAELQRCLESVAAIEDAKRGAERIHAALTVYGITLDPLPWKARKGGTKAASRAPATQPTGTCIKCAREASLSAFMRVADGYVCRKAVECEARAQQAVPA